MKHLLTEMGLAARFSQQITKLDRNADQGDLAGVRNTESVEDEVHTDGIIYRDEV